MVTFRPRHFNRRPSEDAVSPFPNELATPPVTKMCFVTIAHPNAQPRPRDQPRDCTLPRDRRRTGGPRVASSATSNPQGRDGVDPPPECPPFAHDVEREDGHERHQ